MKIVALPLASAALVLLSSCGSNAVKDFNSYEISTSDKCEFKNGKVTQSIRISGNAKGSQTVKVEFSVENDNGATAAKGTKSYRVEDDFNEKHEISLEVSEKQWASGYQECYISSEN